MAMNARQTVVGVFDEPAMADRAVDALQNAGFDANQIHYTRHGAGAAGTGGGFFDGVKRFFTGEDPNATGDNGADDFSNMGFNNQEASWYNDQYSAGRAVVTVRSADRADEAMQILRSNGAYNYDMRAGSTAKPAGAYTQTTDTGYAQAHPTDYTNQTTNTYQQHADHATGADMHTDQERTLRLREEQLQATKERVQSGQVNLRKDVVEEQKTINVPVTHEEVYVERRDVAAGQVDDTPIGQDETIRVPVSEEQVNVTKNAVVTGEVSVGKRAVTENQQVTDTVQHEEARVGRDGDVNVQGSGANLMDRAANTVDNTRDNMANRRTDTKDDNYTTRRTTDDPYTTDTDTRNSL